MAQIPMIYRVDLSETVNVTPLRTLFAMGDDQAHRFEIKLTRGTEPVDLAGSTVYGEFTNFTPHATTVNLKGMAEGGAAVVVLTKPCYTLEGRFALVIRVKGTDGTTAVFYGDGYMRSTTTDTVIDGDYIIYDVNTLLEKIAEVNAATSAANMAASSATSAAGSANAAAASATTAAQSANNAASSASTAAQAADEAAARLDGMTATATGLPAGSAPTVSVTTGEDGAKRLDFGIPKGEKGDTGATPQLTVTAKTGEPGTQASVTQGGTAENPTLELTIPRGETGDIGGLTINGKAPDASGAVTLTAQDVGALGASEKAADASKLGGQTPGYYAAAEEVSQLRAMVGPFMFRYEAEDGHLYMDYDNGYEADKWSLSADGHLLYTF